MLIIAESQNVFDVSDIRACYYTVDKEKNVSVHIGYPSDRPINTESDHECTSHNVIYSAFNMEVCLALIKCIAASLTSDCKVFDVNANVERIAQLEVWIKEVIKTTNRINNQAGQPTTWEVQPYALEITLRLEGFMEENHIYNEDASVLVSAMVKAGILDAIDFDDDGSELLGVVDTSDPLLKVLDILLGIKYSPILDLIQSE